MRSTSTCAAFFAVVAACAIASAAEPLEVQLDFGPAPPGIVCPTEAEFRSLVAAGIGRDPFVGDASVVARVQIETADASGLVGRLHLAEDAKPPLLARTIESPAGDCAELVEATSFALAMALDEIARSGRSGSPSSPPVAPTRAEDATPASPPVTVAVAPPADEAAPAPDEGDDVTFHAAAGLFGAVATAPAPTAGVAVQIGARSSWASLSLEGRGDLPASTDTADGSVAASTLSGTLLPCVHPTFVFACGAVTLGALRGEGREVDRPETDTTLYAAVGGRLGLEVPLVDRWSLRLYADLAAPLTRTSLRLEERTVWTTPALNGALGAAGVASF